MLLLEIFGWGEKEKKAKKKEMYDLYVSLTHLPVSAEERQKMSYVGFDHLQHKEIEGWMTDFKLITRLGLKPWLNSLSSEERNQLYKKVIKWEDAYEFISSHWQGDESMFDYYHRRYKGSNMKIDKYGIQPYLKFFQLYVNSQSIKYREHYLTI